jgi:hypothetical protein
MEGDYGTGAFVSCGHSSPPGRIAARRSGVAQRFVSRPPGYSLHNRQTEHPRLRPPLGRSKAVSAARRCRSGSRIELPDFVAPPLCLCWSLYRVGLPLRAHLARNSLITLTAGIWSGGKTRVASSSLCNRRTGCACLRLENRQQDRRHASRSGGKRGAAERCCASVRVATSRLLAP